MRPDDEARFTEFVRANTASLFRTAFLMTGDHQRAEDVLQDALVKIYKHWTRIDSMSSPLAYCRRIVLNQGATSWRRRSSRETPRDLPEEPTWDGRVEELAEHERIWQAVLSLPPRQRAVMVLRYYEDLTEAQVAETLGLAIGTIKSQSHAAHRRLTDLLGESALSTGEVTS